MTAKHLLALVFFVVLLFLPAGSVFAQGPYDPRVTAKFVGKWKWLEPPGTFLWVAPYMEIEDGSTHAILRMWNCLQPCSDPQMGECLPLQCDYYLRPVGEITASTQGDKLVYTYRYLWTEQLSAEDVNEYVILSNGHILRTQTTYFPPAEWHLKPKFFEYVRVSSIPSVASAAVPNSVPTPLPTVVPPQPVKPTVAGSGGYCGPDTATEQSWIDSLIGVQAAGFPEGQCTGLAANKRPDVWDWIGNPPRPAYIWDDRARANGAKFGVLVRDQPFAGDIAVWERGCGSQRDGYADSTNGHVAYVTRVNSDGSFQVQEANWDRTNPNITVQSCMSFISPEGTILPKPPSPIEQFWNWLKSLFKG